MIGQYDLSMYANMASKPLTSYFSTSSSREGSASKVDSESETEQSSSGTTLAKRPQLERRM